MAGLEGTNVGPYEMKALLGVGGMGQVYRARDPRLEREVAVKVLTDALAKEPGYLDRFRREARAVARLNHPNVVQIYDFGEQGNLTYLVMPLITGGTLREYLAQRRLLPLPETVSIIDQVAGALQYAHEHGLVHRDVKPANILLSTDGRALLSDFGIVRLMRKEEADGTLTNIGGFVGSPEYAAPEMIMGAAIDHRVDVYALGVVFFRMLTGQLPFAGATPVSLMMMQAQQPPPMPRSLNPAIPLAVEAVILRALAKKPDERFQTMAEFRAALRAVSAAPPAETRQDTAPTAGTIGNLPTMMSHGTPLVLNSGLPAFQPVGPGPGSPPVWVGPASSPTGWAALGSGPAITPPIPPTFATGLAISPNQIPVAPPLATRTHQRRMLLVLAVVLALVLVGGSIGVWGVFFNKSGTTQSGTPLPGATSTSTVVKATATLTPTPPPAGIVTEVAVPTASSAPSAITKGPDGSLWFTEGVGNKIGRITPGGTITEFDVPSSNQGYGQGITAGPDGNLWFTEPVDNWIGRITPNGEFSKFTVPTANGSPVGITAGPDGNLWFTESDSKRIGRITRDGTITEVVVPIANSHPFYITAGPDGNLWFTDAVNNEIVRMTLGGTTTEFTIPTAKSGPNGITKGPDGNLWFTENAGSKIGRITPNGDIKEFEIPTANSVPVGITAGPDGNVWFAENVGNKIGRITPEGTITEFPVPTPQGNPSGITVGPDNALWFTEGRGNKIGRITSGK